MAAPVRGRCRTTLPHCKFAGINAIKKPERDASQFRPKEIQIAERVPTGDGTALLVESGIVNAE